MSKKRKLICPFCKEEVKIQLTDEEGNWRSEDYLNDPWSGVSYVLTHSVDNGCLIATYEGESLGKYMYDSEKEIIDLWENMLYE